jgi:hypothetical protein
MDRTSLVQTIVWRRLDLPGHEFGILVHRDESWLLAGRAVLTYEAQPCLLNYRIVCDNQWCTKSANLTGRIGPRDVQLQIAADDERRWQLNGVECPEVEGCTDIDLGFSPSTNLLAIRRLSLAVGEEAELEAAWLPFPALTFERLEQKYRRESEFVYRYESGGGEFVRSLQVNAAGFVTSYPGLWEAESSL